MRHAVSTIFFALHVSRNKSHSRLDRLILFRPVVGQQPRGYTSSRPFAMSNALTPIFLFVFLCGQGVSLSQPSSQQHGVQYAGAPSPCGVLRVPTL